jgi:hypothetical protein
MSLLRSAVLLCVALVLTAPVVRAADSPEHAAHLASYRSKATAERGWRILADAYSSVLYFHPVIREVDLPGKGHFFRLYADGDQQLLVSLCDSMRQRALYCVLHPVNP